MNADGRTKNTTLRIGESLTVKVSEENAVIVRLNKADRTAFDCFLQADGGEVDLKIGIDERANLHINKGDGSIIARIYTKRANCSGQVTVPAGAVIERTSGKTVDL